MIAQDEVYIEPITMRMRVRRLFYAHNDLITLLYNNQLDVYYSINKKLNIHLQDVSLNEFWSSLWIVHLLGYLYLGWFRLR